LSLARRIKAMIEKAETYHEKAENLYKSAGIHIAEIKDKRPDDWEAIVKDECGLGRSRAYELMAIADGRTTLEKVRASTNERKKIHRTKPKESVPERIAEEQSADEMPTEEEADESWQNDLYDQACLLLERMTDATKQRLFAHIDRLKAAKAKAAA
jgi:hypothetical protein